MDGRRIGVLRTFDGFLGGGRLRSSVDPYEYYVLYRFDSDAHLEEWLSSRGGSSRNPR